MLTFAKLQKVNLERCVRWHDPATWSVSEWTNALAGEAGEASNQAKKLLRFDTGMTGPNGKHNNGDSREAIVAAIGAELADVVIYADLVAQRLELDLERLVREKFNETSRKYGFPETL